MKSVHTQDYRANLSLTDDKLMVEMDTVREICSAILGIRKKFGLRARLPLNKVTIVGANAILLENYRQFILEEANVKKVIFDPNFSRESKVKLEIIFEKVGKKFGNKVPEILKALETDSWKKLSNGSALIANEILSPDDFKLKLIPTFTGENYDSIGSDFLVILDINVSPELEMEGIVRDFVRAVQNQRKKLQYDVSEKISLWYSGDDRFEAAISQMIGFIKEQCLAQNAKKQKWSLGFEECNFDGIKGYFMIDKAA